MCMKKAAAEKRLLSAEEKKPGKNMDYATKDGPFFWALRLIVLVHKRVFLRNTLKPLLIK